MEYFLKKEVIIILLYAILIGILRSGDEKKKITYWQIVESFIIVVGLEAMTGYYGASMQSNTAISIYAMVQWLLLNVIYLIVGLTVYHACTQSEMSYTGMWKRFPSWVRIFIPISIILGSILTLLDCYYVIKITEQFQEQLRQGSINFMETLLTDSASPYYRLRELLRFLNIGTLIYGCNTVYKSYDKSGI